ncbi:MAG: hypothetical protein J6Z12_05440, partial [Paludibacteraceae bacterium]|nr:hypothetical protein [Paludibacteraceae bacterium]
MSKTFFDRNWWKDLSVAIIATTISIILTFGTAAIVNRVKREKSRKMTAMMVLGSVETFVRGMEDQAAHLGRMDTVSTWLLSIPTDKIAQMDQDSLTDYLEEARRIPALLHDKTSENIFTNHIETWETMGNFGFIDHVGESFNGINWVIDTWQEEIDAMDAVIERIYNHPDNYPGKTLPEKYLRDAQFRSRLSHLHSLREWLEYNIYQFRGANRKSMWLIGIPEQEVMDYVDSRLRNDEYDAYVAAAEAAAAAASGDSSAAASGGDPTTSASAAASSASPDAS